MSLNSELEDTAVSAVPAPTRRRAANPELNLDLSAMYPTVEIDTDLVPSPYEDGKWESQIGIFLNEFVRTMHIGESATIWTKLMPSVNFHHVGSSVFVIVAGSRSDALTAELEEHLRNLLGREFVRSSDYVHGREVSQWRSTFHIQDGIVWEPEDAVTWMECTSHRTIDVMEASTSREGARADTTAYWDDDESTSQYSRRRKGYRARNDAAVGVILARIELRFGLPEGSVRIIGPEGLPLRRDAKIGTLRKRWDTK